MKTTDGNRKNGGEQKYIWLILLVVFAVGLVLCVTILGVRHYRQKKAEEQYSQLVEIVNDTASTETEDSGEPETEIETEDILAALGIEIPDKNIDFEALWEENADIYAWIYIPDTDVDYPVLQHPTDDSYYLNHNMDGSSGYPGCIYTELLNSTDFTDPNTVLYGHNMKDGSMFGTLHNFEDDENFAGDHYIYIYTPDKTFVYQIFAAYEYPSLHLLYNFDFSDPEVYADYLDKIYEVTGRVVKVRQDIRVSAEQRIITLSTCTTDGEDSLRYLVQGVLLNDEN